jgi:hypothetical protein
MSVSGTEMLEARITLLERRLQFISDELAAALASALPDDQRVTPAGKESPASPTARATKAVASPFPATAHLHPEDISPFAVGFYEREYDESGRPFRWTGNGPICEFRFFVDRSADRPFRMNIGADAPGVLAGLAGFVDYAPISLAIDRDGQSRFVRGVVPKRQHTRLAVVTFLLARSPGTAGETGPAQQQWLGFRFYSFGVGIDDATP